jgi:hypothetical protein
MASRLNGPCVARARHRARGRLARPLITAVVFVAAALAVFDPSMPTSQIQATVDAIAAQQVDNSWARSATRCCSSPAPTAAADPLNFQVGYYTEVAGLGASPGDVTINGTSTSTTSATARQLHRAEQLLALAVEPDDQRHGPASAATGRVLGVSQAAPMRRVTSPAATDADGLLHGRPAVRERRLHRRLAVPASSTARSSSSSSATAASTAGRTASGTRSSPASSARPRSRSRTRRTRRSRPAR